MIAEKKPKTKWSTNESLKAEIVALVAAIESDDSEHGAQTIPRYWQLGGKLARFEGELEQKYELAKGQPRYYRARRINRYFSSLARARAFQGFLRDLMEVMKKGIKGRQAIPDKVKAARALINATHGSVQEALRLLIQEAHCKISDALEWLQKVEAERRGSK